MGPTFGGILFSLGGYMLPFIVMGSILLMDGALIFWFLPSFHKDGPKTGGMYKDEAFLAIVTGQR